MTPKARLTAFIISGAAIGMLGLSFAAEPLYSTFCRVTGFGGTTQVATKPSRRVLDRMVRVRFDANV
jgi:cytochrome c oxidase assembly protein subunit 11